MFEHVYDSFPALLDTTASPQAVPVRVRLDKPCDAQERRFRLALASGSSSSNPIHLTASQRHVAAE